MIFFTPFGVCFSLASLPVRRTEHCNFPNFFSTDAIYSAKIHRAVQPCSSLSKNGKIVCCASTSTPIRWQSSTGIQFFSRTRNPFFGPYKGTNGEKCSFEKFANQFFGPYGKNVDVTILDAGLIAHVIAKHRRVKLVDSKNSMQKCAIYIFPK